MSYHAGKQYLYLVASLEKEEKSQRCLWVYDLKRECMIMSPVIKSNISKVVVGRVWVT